MGEDLNAKLLDPKMQAGISNYIDQFFNHWFYRFVGIQPLGCPKMVLIQVQELMHVI